MHLSCGSEELLLVSITFTIHLSHKCLFPGALLDTGYIAVNKIEKSLHFTAVRRRSQFL